MKALYPGLRVKVVANVGDPKYDFTIGREGVIDCIYPSEGDPPYCWLPGHRISVDGPGLRTVVFHPDDLEPILPEGLVDEVRDEVVSELLATA